MSGNGYERLPEGDEEHHVRSNPAVGPPPQQQHMMTMHKGMGTVGVPAPVGERQGLTQSLPGMSAPNIFGGGPRRGRMNADVLQRNARMQRPNIKPGKPIAPGQPPQQNRIKDRFVSLPESEGDEDRKVTERPSIFDDLEQGGDVSGRITSYCVAESIDRKVLEETLHLMNVSMQAYPEALYARHEYMGERGNLTVADVFYFDYGVVVMWNMSLQQERVLLQKVLKPAMIDALASAEMEIDEFLFHYTLSEKPHIQNDIFTINYRHAGDHLLKMSVSHALAQSTKLSVYEYRVVAIVEETKDLPEILASSGKVKMTRKQIAQLMGRVFLQKSAVNLLSSVLDTPDFFWDQPDSLQALYSRSSEYLEYENRVEVLNSRFQVLQEMLDMLRDHQNNNHTARLEWIVIWLILVEIIVGVFECLGIFGLVQ